MTPPSESTSGLVGLEKRLEQASGPDREIDAELYVLALRRTDAKGSLFIVGPPAYDPPRRFFNPDVKVDWVGYDLSAAPEYTASINCTLALVSQCLPDADWSVDGDFHELTDKRAEISFYGANDLLVRNRVKAPTPALAICLALVRVLKASAWLPEARSTTTGTIEDSSAYDGEFYRDDPEASVP